MGWLDRLRAKLERKLEQVEEVPERAEKVDFNNIEQFIEARTKSQVEEIKKRAGQLGQDLISSFKDLKVTISALKDAEIETRASYPEKVFSVGRSVQQQFCQDAPMALDRLKLRSLEYEGIAQFVEDADSTFKKLNLGPKKGEVLFMLFQHHMRDIGQGLKRIKSQLNEFNSFFGKDCAVLRRARGVKSKVEEIKEILAKIQRNQRQLEAVGESIKDLQEQKKKEVGALRSLEGSKMVGSASALAQELDQLDEEKKQAEQEIGLIFNPFKKIIKKFRHEVKGSKNLDLLKSYYDCAQAALLDDSSLRILAALPEIRNAVAKDLISVRNASKILGSVESSDLSKIRSNYKIIVGKIDKKQKEVGELQKPIVKEQEQILKEISSIKYRLEDLEREEKSLNRTIKKEEELVKESILGLEKLASLITGAKISIEQWEK